MPEDREILRDLAGFLAPMLTRASGTRWTVDTAHGHWPTAALAGPDQQALLVQLSGASMVTISGIFPRGVDGPVPREQKRINVTRTRPIEQIAAEITIRLLPGYRAELARVQGVIAAQAAEAAQRQAALEGLLRLPTVRSWDDAGVWSFRPEGAPGHHVITFGLSPDGTEIEFVRGRIWLDLWTRMLAAAGQPAAQVLPGSGPLAPGVPRQRQGQPHAAPAPEAVGEAGPRESSEADHACAQCGLVLPDPAAYARPHLRGDRAEATPCRYVRFFAVHYLQDDVVDGDLPRDDVREELADCSPATLAADLAAGWADALAEELAEITAGDVAAGADGHDRGSNLGEFTEEQRLSVVAATRALDEHDLAFEGGTWFDYPDGSSVVDHYTGERAAVTGHLYGFTDTEHAAVADRLTAIIRARRQQR